MNSSGIDLNIKAVIENYADGSQTILAQKIGGNCRQGHVYQWLNKLKKLSPAYAKKMKDVSEGTFPAHIYHPEVFDKTA